MGRYSVGAAMFKNSQDRLDLPARSEPNTPGQNRRIAREMATVEVMIHMYCRDLHAPNAGLCGECTTLLEYAHRRLAICPMRSAKPTCAQCLVHCYRPDVRERIRKVMRYAGPRMIIRHPVMAILHIVDGLRSRAKRKAGIGVGSRRSL